MKKFSGEEVVKLMAVVAVMVAVGAFADAQQLCGLSYVSLANCLPAVKQPNPVDPTSACCSALKQGNVTCLCEYKDDPILKDLKIDSELIMKLPTECHIDNVPCRSTAPSSESN